MSDILSKNYTFTLPGTILLIAGIVFVLLLLISLLSIRSRYTAYQRAQNTPKTGFLGKPLMQLSLSLVVTASLIGAVYLVSNDQLQDVDIQADKEYDIILDHRSRSLTSTNNNVTFEATPLINQKEWGEDATLSYDIIWNIKNLQTGQVTDQFEAGRSLNTKSGFSKELADGTYQVVIIFVKDRESFKKDFVITIQ